MTNTSAAVLLPHRGPRGWSSTALHWSSVALVFVSWLSAAVFGLYILAFYVSALTSQHLDQWNNNLSGLYEKGHPVAVGAMAAHLVTGGVILLLGPIQLIGPVRRRWPALHRWLGRIYVFTSFIAGLGGLGFILLKGTIGGGAMNLGFGLYGALMILASVQAYRYARLGLFRIHRAWSIRLFALAIGSWLYRMDYGFWLLLAHRLGHTKDFHGPFDVIMSFFFYLPNLALAELFIRADRFPAHSAFRLSTAAILNIATLLVAVGSYYFIRYYWGPAILSAF